MTPQEFHQKEQELGLRNLQRAQLENMNANLTRLNENLASLNFRLEHLVALGILASDDADILKNLAKLQEQLYDR